MAAHDYRERLWLGPVGWLSALGFAVSLGIAYAAATTALWGWIVAGLCAVTAAAFAVRSAPVVAVERTYVSAGRARIPVSQLDGARALSAAEVTALRRNPEGSRGWWCAPGWVRTAVLLTVNDESDPHAFWVVATRRPEKLTQVLAVAGVPRLRHEPTSDR